ncbi:MAG: bifunctional glutamate N-acetyltransferase/amino-acid acetyltransferase ArgJ [Ruminococcaceae bacterium]|nr:bifunctional glutamate N-acetyltransferase/amino-acid acetyltransferase ArgJ [Oscillospiraceae bacterium]
MKAISGGVCAAKGFTASGVHCGIRKNRTKRDVALIFSERRAAAAACYTQNLVKGAPIYVTKKNIADGYAQAMICNSGNANTCNANGIEIAEETCALLGAELGIPASDVIVASTGVIGQPMSIEPFKVGIPALHAALGAGSKDAAEGIMTTDTRMKEVAFSFEVGGVECKIGAIAKGSGMIHPNMATMLIFITTDCAISPAMLQAALSEDVKSSFNMISVDGDTSTNDMVSIMANGLAGNAEITAPGADFDAFCEALAAITHTLCPLIARDGEGATRLVTCTVRGAKTQKDAVILSKSVICSSLVKAAMFGADANCGRIMCAMGYSGAELDVTKADVSYISKAGEIMVCRDGNGLVFDEDLAKAILMEEEITVAVQLQDGDYEATAWGCDLTYDYVKINGDYRT